MVVSAQKKTAMNLRFKTPTLSTTNPSSMKPTESATRALRSAGGPSRTVPEPSVPSVAASTKAYKTRSGRVVAEEGDDSSGLSDLADLSDLSV